MGTVDVMVGCSLVAVLMAMVAAEGAAAAHALVHMVNHYAHLVGSENE